MIEKRKEHFINFGNSLPHAKVYFRDDWGVYYFDVLGKQFGLMTKEESDESIITLKGLPENNEVLRETYTDIVPGYYANKKHWNSIYLKTEELTDSEIEKMIQHSYDLVWQKIPKKIKEELK